MWADEPASFASLLVGALAWARDPRALGAGDLVGGGKDSVDGGNGGGSEGSLSCSDSIMDSEGEADEELALDSSYRGEAGGEDGGEGAMATGG